MHSGQPGTHNDRNASKRNSSDKPVSSVTNSCLSNQPERATTPLRARVFLRSEVVDADPPVNRGRPREWGRNRQAPVRSTGVLGAACGEGDLGNWGRSGTGGGRTSNVVVRMTVSPEVGEGHGTVEAG